MQFVMLQLEVKCSYASYMVHLYTSKYHGLSIRRRCLQIERNSERRVCVQ